MNRQERRIYAKCIAIMAAYIIAGAYFYTMPTQAHAESAKKGACEASAVSDEEIIAETAEAAKSPQIREINDMSGMPCENREQFERWHAEYEQTASEETERDADGIRDSIEGNQEDGFGTTGADTETVQHENEEDEAGEEVLPDAAESQVVYSVNGEVMNPDLQTMLYDALDRHGISYWYEIGICQMWQESQGDIYAVNPVNHEDMGVLQYKDRYWDWSLGDIFDPTVQIELYATQMAARLNQGLSADECISRHKTSDYCPTVDWGYVAEVKQHLNNLRKESK